MEIKLPVADRKAILRRLQELKATGGERFHEMNTLYDTPDGALVRVGKMLRIRVLSPARPRRAGKKRAKKRPATASRQPALLTYKGPAQDGAAAGSGGRQYKIREEQEVQVEDAAALARVFEATGLRPCFRYEKYRSSYRLRGLPGLAVELDETPIGDFLELEGSPAEIDRCAALLGFGAGDYIAKSYGALFVEQRQRAAVGSGSAAEWVADSVDMLF